LETSVYWLSEDLVTFEIEVGVYKNLQKCNSDFDFLLCKQQALLRQTMSLIFSIGALAAVSSNKYF